MRKFIGLRLCTIHKRTQTKISTKLLCIKDNKWSLYIQRRIMPTSHEEQRDRSLTAEGEPSKAGRRDKKSCVLWIRRRGPLEAAETRCHPGQTGT